MRAVFWASLGLLAYTHAGYPLLLALVARRRRRWPDAPMPPVSLVVAAYNEEAVIAEKVRNARALEPAPAEVIVASDGSTDGTVAAAAGADLVLDLPRAGKVRTQDAAVERARHDVIAFSDANSLWHRDALKRLVAPFADPEVGYACGQVRFTNEAGDNQEGLYWRYEMWVRERESQLAGVTGGNGAIYAVRRDAYLRVDPRMGHDLSFPFNLRKRGWRAVYVPEARAEEKMVPTIEGEFRRKRRMQAHMWPIVLRGGLLDPRGYSPAYAWEILSHRVLRYASPFLHVALLVSSAAVYPLVFAAQAVAGVAALAGVRIARYYVLMVAAIAAGLWDYLRTGTEAGWEQPEGTR